jgi:fatty-acyl-CoA synthase
VVLQGGLNATESEIIGWCKERLASYKKPTQVRFLSDLPRNASGKVLKFELRKLVASSE